MSAGEKFLYLAYVFAGLIYVSYAWNLAWRLRRSRRELSGLKARLERTGPTGSPSG
jgi:hypothetical protein